MQLVDDNLDFCVTINPNFVPEGKEQEFRHKSWDDFLDNNIINYDLRTRDMLQYKSDVKILLSGKYEDVKGFLRDTYGYIDYSCIYLWGARIVDVLNEWKLDKNKSLELWRLI